MDRRAVEAVKSMPEHRRYLRGMFAWVGYDQSGVQLRVLGIMGEYIFRIHDEVKRRPLYFVRDQVGVDAAAPR